MKTMAVQCHIIHPTGWFSGLGPRSVWFPRGFLKRFSACQARQVGTWFYPQLQPSATLQVSGSSLCLSNPEALATAQRGKSWKGIGKKNHEKTMGSWIGNIFWQRNKGWVMLSTQSDATPVTLLLKSSASMYHHTVDDCWQEACSLPRLHTNSRFGRAQAILCDKTSAQASAVAFCWPRLISFAVFACLH